MFENPHIIYIIAKQRQKELLDELEKIRKMESSSVIAKKKNRRFGKIMLPIADLFIAIGLRLKRRYHPVFEEFEDAMDDVLKP